MSRQARRSGNSEKNITMWVLGGIVLVLIIAFVLVYIINTGKAQQAKTPATNTQKISKSETTGMLNMITNSENTQTVSSSIGKSVNEVESTTENSQENENTTKVAINTSKIEEQETETQKIENEETENTESANNEENAETQEPTADPTFAKPVEGEIIKDYSKDNLIYSNTLEEWTTHMGIDFASEKTDIVKAAADGTVKSIKNDPRYGLTVAIEHTNGFESIYSSLLTAEFITVGEKVTQGQTIATVGNTATFEIADETHLHFEIKKDGINVEPNIYIKN